MTAKKSGHLYANAETTDDNNARFYFELANRPVLVLKCEQGFVGSKSGPGAPVGGLECNKATYDTILVERGEKGIVYFQGAPDFINNIFSFIYRIILLYIAFFSSFNIAVVSDAVMVIFVFKRDPKFLKQGHFLG